MLKLKVSISARLYDHHHNLVRTYRPRPAHSFLAQFIEFLFVQMSQTAAYITDIVNAENEISPHASNFRISAPASNLTYGLLIGSGTNPVDIDDYKLQSQITTDITVSVHTFGLSYPTASSRRLSISRTFTNSTASPIPIEEVALYMADGIAYYECLDRTLYSTAIPASSTLELTYRIDVSV